jgi:hypothetical protein
LAAAFRPPAVAGMRGNAYSSRPRNPKLVAGLQLYELFGAAF